jgi:hypothetical protein
MIAAGCRSRRGEGGLAPHHPVGVILVPAAPAVLPPCLKRAPAGQAPIHPLRMRQAAPVAGFHAVTRPASNQRRKDGRQGEG